MNAPVADPLERCRIALRNASFAVEEREVADLGVVLIAETAYALVISVACEWDDVLLRSDKAQVELTRIAAIHPSARSWDLYVVLVMGPSRSGSEQIRERLESDTSYARKLVITGPSATERRLLALKPLMNLPSLEPVEPLRELQRRLIAARIAPWVIDQAITSFADDGHVDIS